MKARYGHILVLVVLYKVALEVAVYVIMMVKWFSQSFSGFLYSDLQPTMVPGPNQNLTNGCLIYMGCVNILRWWCFHVVLSRVAFVALMHVFLQFVWEECLFLCSPASEDTKFTRDKESEKNPHGL
jgi:hypothetical protein